MELQPARCFCYCLAGLILVAGLSVSDYDGARTLLKHADEQPAESQVSSGPKELYFTQTLDHFNFVDNRTWDQRYFLIGMYVDLADAVLQLERVY